MTLTHGQEADEGVVAVDPIANGSQEDPRITRLRALIEVRYGGVHARFAADVTDRGLVRASRGSIRTALSRMLRGQSFGSAGALLLHALPQLEAEAAGATSEES